MNVFEIIKCLKNNPDYSGYGLRRIDAEYMPNVGDEVPFSFDWDRENDCSSDELLCGASCIGIDVANMMIYLDNMDASEEVDVLIRIELALKQIEKNNYSGEVILVAGDFKGHGDDNSEFLIDGIRLL